jgi:hypothetical protein
LLVEASGVPVGLCVAGANKNDFKLFVCGLIAYRAAGLFG